MSETNVIEQTPWADRQLTEAQQRNRDNAAVVPVGQRGTMPQTFADLVIACQWMAAGKTAVPAHLIGNTGACVAVYEMAAKWNFPAYQVARQTYVVNGVMAWQGALIMAVINMYCPLERRLRFEFSGEGQERVVKVIGQFKGETEPCVYESPPLRVFKGTGKSPLWSADPDQQMIYLASRRWQLRYWPEGLFGIYSPEEMEDTDLARHVGAHNAKDITPGGGGGLIERLKSAQQQPGEVLVEQGDAAGFDEANVNAELDQTQANGKPDADEAKARAKAVGEAKAAEATVVETIADKPATTEAATLKELPKPKSAKDWAAYTLRWIEIGDGDLMARWRAEMKLRNKLGITEEERDPVFEKLTERING